MFGLSLHVIYVKKKKYAQKFLHGEYRLYITILTVGNSRITLHISQLLSSNRGKKLQKNPKYFYKPASDMVRFKIWCPKNVTLRIVKSKGNMEEKYILILVGMSCRTLVRGCLKHVHKKLLFETARDINEK
jgi:hypothetical protein